MSFYKNFLVVGSIVTLMPLAAYTADNSHDPYTWQLPVGSVITLPLRAVLIHAQDNSIRLGDRIKTSDGSLITCKLSFDPSNQDRELPSSILQIVIDKPLLIDNEGSEVIEGDSKLNGKSIDLTLSCHSEVPNPNRSQCTEDDRELDCCSDYNYDYSTIGELGDFLRAQGGSLSVSPPVSFVTGAPFNPDFENKAVVSSPVRCDDAHVASDGASQAK